MVSNAYATRFFGSKKGQGNFFKAISRQKRFPATGQNGSICLLGAAEILPQVCTWLTKPPLSITLQHVVGER